MGVWRASPHTGFDTPAGSRLPDGLDSVLAAQAMFPVTSREEMRGTIGDKDIFGKTNELAAIPDFDIPEIWRALMSRLLALPGYVDLFTAAYPEVAVEDLGFEHAANALAAYQSRVFTFEDSEFDQYLRGEQAALSNEAKQGALLFYGKGGCANCHSGGLLTDQKFHNMATPQVGPGKGREKPLDLGRARETGNDCDRYSFRTPPLRNVAVTGPWMHNGSITTLEGVIRHHLQPVEGLQSYDPGQLAPELEETCQDQPEVLAGIIQTFQPVESAGVQLSDAEMASLLAFLDALTSPKSQELSHIIPDSVPSGLTVGGN